MKVIRLLLLSACLLEAPCRVRGRWEALSDPIPENWGEVVNVLADPLLPNTWIIGTANGIAESTDDGRTFEFRPHRFLDAWFLSVAADSDNSQRLWAMLPYSCWSWGNALLLRSMDRGASWDIISQLDLHPWELLGVFCDGTVLFALKRTTYPHEDDSTACLERSTDSGQSWSEFDCTTNEVSLYGSHGSSELFLRFLYGHNDEYNPVSGLYHSTDYGAAWDALPYPTADEYWENDALAVGGPDGMDLYLLATPGQYGYSAPRHLYHSTDRGTSWTAADGDLAQYYPALTGSLLSCSAEGTVYYSPLDDEQRSSTVPVVRSMNAGYSWLPADLGFIAGERLPNTVPKTQRLIVPWWAPEKLYALVADQNYVQSFCSFTVSPSPPLITVAGWEPDCISAAAGGQVRLFAYVVDAEADRVSVEIFYAGRPTGVLLKDVGDGLHEITVRIPPGALAPGYIMVELQATDAGGLTSMRWPYLQIGATGAVPSSSPPVWQESPHHSQPQARPAILAGGWGFGAAAGQPFPVVCFAALLADPNGAEDINLVEIMWQGLPTGQILEPNDLREPYGYQCDFSGCAGSYGMIFDSAGAPPGMYYLELQARDRAGNRSGLWPYLTVTP